MGASSASPVGSPSPSHRALEKHPRPKMLFRGSSVPRCNNSVGYFVSPENQQSVFGPLIIYRAFGYMESKFGHLKPISSFLQVKSKEIYQLLYYNNSWFMIRATKLLDWKAVFAA